jgi:membrane protease YdiL (CAAX protease family)
MQHVFGMLLPFLLYLKYTKQRFKDVLPWTTLGSRNALLVIVFTLAYMPIIHLLVTMYISIFPPAAEFARVMEGIFVVESTPVWAIVFVVAIIPSIVEEIWFRGVLYTEYSNVPIMKVAIINGLIFGIIHFNFLQLLTGFLMGFLCTYLVYLTRTILAPILFHFVNNAFGVIFAEMFSINLHEFSTHNIPVLLISSLVALPMMILCFRKLRAYHAQSKPVIDEQLMGEEVVVNQKIMDPALIAILVIGAIAIGLQLF